MQKVLFVISALMFMVGCQPTNSLDFWGPKTVAPPATGTATPPAVNNQYYPNQPAPTTMQPLSNNAATPAPTTYYTPPVAAKASTKTAKVSNATSSGLESIRRVGFQKDSSSTSGEPEIKIIESIKRFEPESATSLKDPTKKATQLQPTEPITRPSEPTSGVTSIFKNKNSSPAKNDRFRSSTNITPNNSTGTNQERSILANPSVNKSVNNIQVVNTKVTARGKSRYGYRTDHTELRGRLEYSQSRKTWKLRYIPIDGTTDQYGGSVQLANKDLLDGRYRDGDYVQVRGTVEDARGNQEVFAPLYRVNSIQSTE